MSVARRAKVSDMDVFASIKAFVAVADEGGFAKAARKAGAATSSMTRQVDALEEHLGTILLNRSTRRVTLTPAGEAYYVQAARILSDLEEANRSVSELSGPPRGLLRVTLPVAFARLHVAPIVSEFLKSCPEIELELLMTDNVVNLVEDRIDMAIRIGSLKSSSLVARKLAPHRRVVCASHEYLKTHGEPGVPTDLAKHNCLTFSYSTGDRTWRFARAGQDEQVRVRGNLRDQPFGNAERGGAGRPWTDLDADVAHRCRSGARSAETSAHGLAGERWAPNLSSASGWRHLRCLPRRSARLGEGPCLHRIPVQEIWIAALLGPRARSGPADRSMTVPAARTSRPAGRMGGISDPFFGASRGSSIPCALRHASCPHKPLSFCVESHSGV